VGAHGCALLTVLSRPPGSSTTALYLFDVSHRSTTVLLENPSLQKFVWSPDERYLLLTMSISFEGGSRDPLSINEITLDDLSLTQLRYNEIGHF
jgi:hypothetical protein